MQEIHQTKTIKLFQNDTNSEIKHFRILKNGYFLVAAWYIWQQQFDMEMLEHMFGIFGTLVWKPQELESSKSIYTFILCQGSSSYNFKVSRQIEFLLLWKKPHYVYSTKTTMTTYTNHNTTAIVCVVMLKLQNINSLTKILFSFHKMDIIRYWNSITLKKPQKNTMLRNIKLSHCKLTNLSKGI